MNKREVSRNLFSVILSALITTGTGLITGFLIPKFFTVENYAYYKMFSMYLGYVGVLHLGFADGVLIRFGNHDYDMLPKKTMRRLIRVFILWHIIVSTIISVLIFSSNIEWERKICLMLVCINITFVNCNNLFSFINQCTKCFKWDSRLRNIQAIASLIIAGIVLFFRLESYIYYVLLITAIYAGVFCIHIFYYREQVFGEAVRFRSALPMCKKLVKIGFLVMISQLMGEIILGFDRLLIENFMPLSDFAVYSFAVSIVGIIFGVLSTTSKIVYPYLARVKKEELGYYYEVLLGILVIITGIMLNGTFVVVEIIKKFIPNYNGAIDILRFLLPTILFKVLINFLGSNYFKLLRMERKFVINNLVALILAVGTDIIALVVFGNIKYIAIASLLTFVIWFLITHVLLCFEMRINLYSMMKNSIVPLFLVILIVLVGAKGLTGVVLYNVGLLFVVTFFYRKEVNKFLNKYKK